MNIKQKLFGDSSSQDNEEKNGIVWSKFERKYETWHFGPEDEKNVVYDGISNNILYRFVDDTNAERRTVSYNKEIFGKTENELIVKNKVDERCREKRKPDRTMYLVAEGSWDGDNLRYKSPVLVVGETTFNRIKEQEELANLREATSTPMNVESNT